VEEAVLLDELHPVMIILELVNRNIRTIIMKIDLFIGTPPI
jgi:hypothetical protein